MAQGLPVLRRARVVERGGEVTCWDFLDRALARFRVEHVAGGGVFLLTGLVLFMLRDEPALADNDLFKTLSQAIVVQGLVGLAMAAWFTKRPHAEETAPRDAAEGAHQAADAAEQRALQIERRVSPEAEPKGGT